MIGLAVLLYALTYKTDLAKAQTMVFLIIVFFEMLFSLSARSVRYPVFSVGFFKNKYLLGAIVISSIAAISVTTVPLLQGIFHTTALSIKELGIVFAIASVGFIYLEIHKWIRTRKENHTIATTTGADFLKN